MKIKQESHFLKSLIRSAQEGSVVPAGMQRPYVWGHNDVEALMESLLSGYPVGAFTLWDIQSGSGLDPQSVGKARLGPIVPEHRGATPELLVLDGQNRLASIAWMSVRESEIEALRQRDDISEQERAVWLADQRLVFDGEANAVVFVPQDEVERGLRIPAWVLVESRNMAEVRRHWDRMESEGVAEDRIHAWMRKFDEAEQAFSNARVTSTIIERATPDEARHAFLRICRTGVPMSDADFDAALQWNANDSSDLAPEQIERPTPARPATHAPG